MNKGQDPDINPQNVSPPQAATSSYSTRLPKLFISIVIVAFAVLLGLAAFTRNKKTPSVSSQTTPASTTISTSQTAQVSITSSGFVPATLQVAPNSQVNWTNNDAAAHEVAADPYPKDNSIPGFNNHTVLQKGDTYSFTFSKAGTYTYHDELQPLKILGKIIVK